MSRDLQKLLCLETLYRVQHVWSTDLKLPALVEYGLLEKEEGFCHNGFKS